MALDFMKVTENFDKSLREHEKEIVIDLAIDRFVKFVVTYILGTLAVATGIFLIAGNKIVHILKLKTCLNLSIVLCLT